MENGSSWVDNRKVLLLCTLLVLSPGIAKVILSIIGIF